MGNRGSPDIGGREDAEAFKKGNTCVPSRKGTGPEREGQAGKAGPGAEGHIGTGTSNIYSSSHCWQGSLGREEAGELAGNGVHGPHAAAEGGDPVPIGLGSLPPEGFNPHLLLAGQTTAQLRAGGRHFVRTRTPRKVSAETKSSSRSCYWHLEP